MKLNPNYTKFVNKTYSKTFSIRQSLPKIIMENCKKTDKILDYGAGKDAFGTKLLNENGFNCTAWEIGDNFDPENHDYHALEREYDVIFASNVLNVQPTDSDVHTIVSDVRDHFSEYDNSGVFYCNFPLKPRHNTVDMEPLLKLCFNQYKKYGNLVEQVKPLVWKCKYVPFRI
jgi:hypothetical protein